MSFTNASHRNAYYFSAITHPLLMPVAGFIILNYFNTTSFEGKYFYILLAVFAVTVLLLPAYFVFSLKRSGYIQSYEMETLRERRLPLVFTCAVMVFNYYLMQRPNLPQPFPLYFLSISLAALLALCISLFYKMSLHTLGIGFLFGLGLTLSRISSMDLRWYLIIISLLSGIIAYCRILLKAHTLPQIYLGFAVGVICSSAIISLL